MEADELSIETGARPIAVAHDGLVEAEGRAKACLDIADRARGLIEFMAMVDGETVTVTQLDELAWQARNWLRWNIPSKAGRNVHAG